MACLDRDGVGALIGQHQLDLVLANRTEVAEQHIFALRCVGIMDCLAGNFCNNTIGGHENLIDEAEVEFFDEQPKARHVEDIRSEEHTSELQSLMRISYAVFCLKQKKIPQRQR